MSTKRLFLVPLTSEDEFVLHDIFTNPTTRRFIWNNDVIPREKTQQILIRSQNHFDSEKWGLWKMVDKTNKEMLGFVGMWYYNDSSFPQLVFATNQESTPIEFAIEAMQCIIDYLFHNLNYNFVYISIDQEDKDSLEVANSLGMKRIESVETRNRTIVVYTLAKKIINNLF